MRQRQIQEVPVKVYMKMMMGYDGTEIIAIK